MAKDRKKPLDETAIDTNAWLTTFADLVMLLLTFFVLLLTMSSMDSKKMKDMFSHFSGAPGVLELSGETRISDIAALVKKYQSTESMLVVDQNLLRNMVLAKLESEDQNKENVKKNFEKLKELINLSDDERGLVITFQGDMLFDSGQSVLKKEIVPFLDMMTDTIKSFQNRILIMGHTDNMPIHSKIYKSNWELSLYRAFSVLSYFLKEKEMDPSLFFMGGYGASKPLHPNDSPENRALNRRVEIIFAF